MCLICVLRDLTELPVDDVGEYDDDSPARLLEVLCALGGPDDDDELLFFVAAAPFLFSLVCFVSLLACLRFFNGFYVCRSFFSVIVLMHVYVFCI